MSGGPRIPINLADEIVKALLARWGRPGAEAVIVGSVRRRVDTVGDLELAAPLPEGLGENPTPDQDPLFRAIDGTMENRFRAEESPLFAGGVSDSIPLGRAEKGLRPGFLACSLIVRPFVRHPDPAYAALQLPVQVYRFTAANKGWVLIERTGPREFGMYFLGAWKKSYGIPTGSEDHRASINGHLVDSYGRVVPVNTEVEAFEKAGLSFIPAAHRDTFMERRAVGRALR